MTSTTRRTFCQIAGAAAVLGARPAAAQERWPQRAIRIVVPYPPGAGTDSGSRRLAQLLTPRLGQPVIVENKTGAMGTIGINEVARARPDGYTLLGIDSGFAILPHLVRAAATAPQDFIPIAAYVFSHLGLVVSANSPYRSLRDVVEAARAAPGRLTFGSGGIGTSPHLAAEDFASRTGLRLMHVPFRGAGEGVQAVLAGTIDMQFASPASVVGNLEPGGRLRMLAIGSERRLDGMSAIPTFLESGVDGFVMHSWVGLFAPTGTPREVLQRLEQEVAAVGRGAEMRAYAETMAAEPRLVAGEDFATLMRTDSNRWKDVIERIGLTPQ